MCSCDIRSLRQEDFTNLSLDLVPEATVEQILQLYLTVGLLLSFSHVTTHKCTSHECLTQATFYGVNRKHSWSTNAAAEGPSRVRGFPLQPCLSE